MSQNDAVPSFKVLYKISYNLLQYSYFVQNHDFILNTEYKKNLITFNY